MASDEDFAALAERLTDPSTPMPKGSEVSTGAEAAAVVGLDDGAGLASAGEALAPAAPVAPAAAAAGALAPPEPPRKSVTYQPEPLS